MNWHKRDEVEKNIMQHNITISELNTLYKDQLKQVQASAYNDSISNSENVFF